MFERPDKNAWKLATQNSSNILLNILTCACLPCVLSNTIGRGVISQSWFCQHIEHWYKKWVYQILNQLPPKAFDPVSGSPKIAPKTWHNLKVYGVSFEMKYFKARSTILLKVIISRSVTLAQEKIDHASLP